MSIYIDKHIKLVDEKTNIKFSDIIDILLAFSRLSTVTFHLS